MRRIVALLVMLTAAAAPAVLGLGATSMALADNGVIHGYGVGTHGSARVLADNGVIDSRN